MRQPGQPMKACGILGFLKTADVKLWSCSVCAYQAAVQGFFAHPMRHSSDLQVCQLSGSKSASQYQLASFSINVSKY